jgi:hypothetical protein
MISSRGKGLRPCRRSRNHARRRCRRIGGAHLLKLRTRHRHSRMLRKHLLPGCERRRWRWWRVLGNHLPASHCLRRCGHAVRSIGLRSHHCLTGGRHGCTHVYRSSPHLVLIHYNRGP